MKKLLVILAFVGIIPLTQAHAAGTTLGALGVNYSLFSSYIGGLGLTGVVGHQNRPFQFSARVNFSPTVSLGFTADWLFLRNRIASTPLYYYLGVGAGIGIGSSFNLGMRLPIAVQWFPIPAVEIYAEWAPGLKVLSTFGFDHALTFGARWHFGYVDSRG